MSGKIQPAIDSQTEELTEASRLASNAITAIDTVKCFNGQNFELWQYTGAVKKAAKWYWVQARYNALQIGFVRIILLGMFVQGFWYGSYLVNSGNKTPGQVLTAFWASLIATQTVEQMLPQTLVLEKGSAAASALKMVLTSLKKDRRISSLARRRKPVWCQGEVQMKNVSSASD